MFFNHPDGLQMEFANGWTVSLSWHPLVLKGDSTETMQTIEVWSWKGDEESYPDEPLGYQNADEVAQFIAEVRAK